MLYETELGLLPSKKVSAYGPSMPYTTSKGMEAPALDSLANYKNSHQFLPVEGFVPPPTFLTDNFNRADGGLGAGWVNFPEGGLAISGNKAIGTVATSNACGSFNNARTYTNDQWSEITIAASSLTNFQWVAPIVRATANGDAYWGLYFNSNGTYQFIVYKRISGTFTQIGSPITLGGPLAIGDKVRLSVCGNGLTLTLNGAEQFYNTTDSSILSGSPGAAATGSADPLDDWKGGDVVFEVYNRFTDGNGVEFYRYNSDHSTGGLNIRVLRPTSPSGHPHVFIYMLPVSPDQDFTFGDSINLARVAGYHNTYNATLIDPGFLIDPWYADHATDTRLRYQSFIPDQLRAWVKANFGTTGNEQHWLLGFSKSGFGGINVLLKYSSLFDQGAFWDLPSTSLVAYDTLGTSMSNNYGTDANFQANYRWTNAYMDAYKAPFQAKKRIYLRGHNFWGTDTAAADTLFTSKSILHDYTDNAESSHAWLTAWMLPAIEGMYQSSLL